MYWNEIINDLAKIITKYERMLGNNFSSFLHATTQIVCPLRWRFWYYITLKVSISFIVTLYYYFSSKLRHTFEVSINYIHFDAVYSIEARKA
jgi:hypothetical protein